MNKITEIFKCTKKNVFIIIIIIIIIFFFKQTKAFTGNLLCCCYLHNNFEIFFFTNFHFFFLLLLLLLRLQHVEITLHQIPSNPFRLRSNIHAQTCDNRFLKTKFHRNNNNYMYCLQKWNFKRYGRAQRESDRAVGLYLEKQTKQTC